MSFELVVTPPFEKDVKGLARKYPSIPADLNKLFLSIEKDPTFGVSLGKDCYKIRMAISSKGRGKSGGARVITCVKVFKNTIYLLRLYDKSDTESLTDSELDMLLKAAGLL